MTAASAAYLNKALKQTPGGLVGLQEVDVGLHALCNRCVFAEPGAA
jgi:hypothetical protein